MQNTSSQLDLLANSFTQTKNSKVYASRSGQKDERESFKTVISRSDDNPPKRQVKETEKSEDNQPIRKESTDKSSNDEDSQSKLAAESKPETKSTREQGQSSDTSDEPGKQDNSDDEGKNTSLSEAKTESDLDEDNTEHALQAGQLPLPLDTELINPQAAANPGTLIGNELPLRPIDSSHSNEVLNSSGKLNSIEIEAKNQQGLSHGQTNAHQAMAPLVEELNISGKPAPAIDTVQADLETESLQSNQEKLTNRALASTLSTDQSQEQNAKLSKALTQASDLEKQAATTKLSSNEPRVISNLGLQGHGREVDGARINTVSVNTVTASLSHSIEETVAKATSDNADISKMSVPETTTAPAKPGHTVAENNWVQHFQQVNGLSVNAKPGAVQLQLPVNVNNPQWFSAMADRVSWLASQNIQAADIQLDPPELGPLQVRITVNQDQASVSFISHQASVRDTLDSQLMRLRELFSNEGLDLVDVNVSDQHQQKQEGKQAADLVRGNDNDSDIGPEPQTIPLTEIKGWVDYYV